jgi:hypothetical protein
LQPFANDCFGPDSGNLVRYEINPPILAPGCFVMTQPYWASAISDRVLFHCGIQGSKRLGGLSLIQIEAKAQAISYTRLIPYLSPQRDAAAPVSHKFKG